MSWRKTIFLAVVLAVVAGLYLWDQQRVSRQKTQEEEQKRLFPWKQEEVSEVILERPSDTIHLVREEGKDWAIKEPVKARADQEEARRLVEGLLRTRRDRLIEKEPSDLQPYGLNKPEYVIRVRAKSAEEQRSVLLGAKNPTEVYHYCQLQGGKEVFLVSDTLRRDAQKSLMELRDKSVLAFDPTRVRSLSVSSHGQEVLLLKEGDKQWRIGEPNGLLADADAIESLLFRLSRLRASSFQDKPQRPLSEMGLEPSERRILLGLKDPEEQKVLLVGKEVQEEAAEGGKKARLWVKLEGDFPVVQVETSQLGEIPLERDGWRSKLLIAFDRDKVQRVDLLAEGRELVLRKVAQNQWEMERPERLNADPVKVSDLLWTLKDGRVARFPGSQESTGAVLEPQALLARIWLEGQDNPLEVRVGQATADGQGRYAMVPAQEELVVVPNGFVEEISKVTPWELREKRFVEFEVTKARRVLLKWDGREMELRRRGESGWQMRGPEQQDLEAYQVSGLLWSVREARFEGLPEHRPPDDELGVDSPKFHVEVFGEGKEPMARLTIGAEMRGSQGLRYAWSDPRGQLYLVGPKLLEQISRDMKAIWPSGEAGGTKSGG